MNITIGGLNINYKISSPEGSKDAPVLVVLQGWGTGMEIYDSVAAAVNDAVRRAEEASAAHMGKLTSGMNLPAGMKLPF